MTAPAHARPLAAAYGGITAVVAPLRDSDLLRPTRCHGWVIAGRHVTDVLAMAEHTRLIVRFRDEDS